MNKCVERIVNGVVKENPTFVLMLGMCPTLAITTSAINGISMGLCTTAVLAMSNLLISMLRKVIPDKVRMPAFIVIVASFVTLVQMLLGAYLPELNKTLGIYIPLIVVNCIILGRAESYAYKNPVLPSFFDGIGMGIGFTIGITLIGMVRELLGAGEIFGFRVMPASYQPISIFVMAPGAFLVLALLTGLQNKFNAPSATNKEECEAKSTPGLECSGNCMSCAGLAYEQNHLLIEQAAEKREAERKAALAEKAKAAAAAKAAKAAESKAAEKPAEDKATEGKVAEKPAAKPAESKPAENKAEGGDNK
ncbi:MAG: electron transport complex subunit E [Lachnospiraceae bacterium]|nr:electron transport complex subunit E [Lachnospiraceae bacterium]